MPSQSTKLHFVPEPALVLKRRANELYTQQDFPSSFALYTRIVDQFLDAPPSFLRVIRCNRAACCIELGLYHDGITDLQWVFASIPSGSREAQSVNQKAHFRFARCLFELQRLGEAVQAIDEYREMMGGQPTVAEQDLRAKIVRAIVARDNERRRVHAPGSAPPESQAAAPAPTTATAVPGRPLRYEVKVFNSAPTIVLYDHIPDVLCTPHPPETASRSYAVKVLSKYHHAILHQQAWACWSCLAPAVSFVHSPALYFHLPEPRMVDYAQPICEDGGACDGAAKRMMAETMRLTARLSHGGYVKK